MRYIRLILFLLLISVLSGCSIAGELNRSNDTVNDYFSNKVDIEDEVIPLSAAEDIGVVASGEVVNLHPMFYGILGIRVDSEHRQLILDMEVLNSGKETIDFTPYAQLRLFDDASLVGLPYGSDPMVSSDVKLGGLIQPGNRIAGEVNFDMPLMRDNSCYLALLNESGEIQGAFKITKDNFDQVYEGHFENDGVISDYGLNTPVESDVLTLTLTEVKYEPSDREGLNYALCRFLVTNNTKEDKTVLTGFNIIDAHDMTGRTLNIDSLKVTIPKTVEANGRVTGVVPVYIGEGVKGFYLTVRPDDSNFDGKEIIVVK